MQIDISIFNFIHQFAGQNKIIDLIAVFFADYLAYFLILFAIILFFKQTGWKNRFYFFALTILSILLSRGIITETIRFFYHRSRPFTALNFEPLISNGSYSFPSGHMAFFFALFIVIFYLNKVKNLSWWFLGLIILMGLARIYAGVHWPSDIVGGAAIGLLSAFFIKKILPKPGEQEVLPL